MFDGAETVSMSTLMFLAMVSWRLHDSSTVAFRLSLLLRESRSTQRHSAWAQARNAAPVSVFAVNTCLKTHTPRQGRRCEPQLRFTWNCTALAKSRIAVRLCDTGARRGPQFPEVYRNLQ